MPEVRQPVAPPPEAVAYLDGKGFKPAFHWQDVWGEEHAFQYTVAKATEMDVLSAIRAATDRAVKEGVPFEQFAKDLTPTLQKLGWWGRQERADPLTGEVDLVQLGSPRRLKTIYWTNTRTAYAAGQWERAQRTKAALPFFIYELGPSIEHRPDHAAIAARPTVLAVDDPYWDTHYPPNGWGCKCRLRQISRRLAESTGISTAPTIEYRIFRNKRTGKETAVPIDIDPGWQTNPGKARARTLMDGLNARVDQANPGEAKAAVRDLWAGRSPEAFARLPDEQAVELPIATSSRAIVDQLGAVAGAVRVDGRLVKAEAFAATANSAEAARRLTDFASVADIVAEPEDVRTGEDGSAILSRRVAGGWLSATLKRSADGIVRLISLLRGSAPGEPKP